MSYPLSEPRSSIIEDNAECDNGMTFNVKLGLKKKSESIEEERIESCKKTAICSSPTWRNVSLF